MYEHLKVSFQLQIKNNIFGSVIFLPLPKILFFLFYFIITQFPHRHVEYLRL